MRFTMERLLAVGLLILLGTSVASTALDRPLDVMFQRADRVVYGEVSEVRVDVVDGAPITRVVLAVERDLQTGDVEEDATVTLSFSAGEGPDGVTFVDDLPIPAEADRILVAFYEDDPAVSPVVGVWQGLWTVREEGLTDLRGVSLGVTGDVVEPYGDVRDVGDVLDLLERALAGEGTARVSNEALSSETPGEEGEVPTLEGGEAEDATEVVTPTDVSATDVTATDVTDTDAAPVDASGSDETTPDDAPEGESTADTETQPETDAQSERDAGTQADVTVSQSDDGETDENGDASTPDDATTPSETDAEAEPGTTPEETPDEEGRDEGVTLTLAVSDDATLRDALRAAAERWREAGAPLQVAFDETASDRIEVGDASLFGPDALSLSRRSAGAEGIEILLRPGSEGRRLDVLAYELGRLAGMTATPRGFRSGRMPATPSDAPSADDAASFVATLTAIPEDVNGDGLVDFYDLVAISRAFGTVGTRVAGDLDGSGEVDDADIERLRAAYEFLPASRDAPEGRTNAAP